MSSQNDLLEELEEILEKNKDAQKGFSRASENAQSAALRIYFERKSQERHNFNNELKNALSSAYTDFDADGSFKGTIHRTWMDVKSFFSSDNDEAMLQESIRGDKAAVEEYDEVIEDAHTPLHIRNLLISQRAKIKEDLARNKTMEDLH